MRKVFNEVIEVPEGREWCGVLRAEADGVPEHRNLLEDDGCRHHHSAGTKELWKGETRVAVSDSWCVSRAQRRLRC